MVFAANVTEDTVELLDVILKNEEFTRFSLQNKLNLSDKTILIRLAIINLKKHVPTNDEVALWKSALLRPQEFDDFLRKEAGGNANAIG